VGFGHDGLAHHTVSQLAIVPDAAGHKLHADVIIATTYSL
jgi:hypothetical protein